MASDRLAHGKARKRVTLMRGESGPTKKLYAAENCSSGGVGLYFKFADHDGVADL